MRIAGAHVNFATAYVFSPSGRRPRNARCSRSSPCAPPRSAPPTGAGSQPGKRNPGARATGPRVCAASAGLPLRWRTSEHINHTCDACCCERLRWLLNPPFLNPEALSPRLVIALGLMRRRASDSESADTRLQSMYVSYTSTVACMIVIPLLCHVTTVWFWRFGTGATVLARSTQGLSPCARVPRRPCQSWVRAAAGHT